MATEQTIKNIKETFIVGFWGIIKISNLFNTAWKKNVTRYSIVISIIVPMISVASGINILGLIIEIKTQMMNILPTILGFTIAGYSLVVGFVQSDLLEKISEPSKDSKFSLYQKMSSIFAINVILQGLALIFACAYHFLIYFDTHNHLNMHLSTSLVNIINIVGLAVITFWLVIALFLIIQIVLNIFNFSQLHHYYINIQKVRSEENKKQSESQ